MKVLKPSGHTGDEGSVTCDRDCELCAYDEVVAALEWDLGPDV